MLAGTQGPGGADPRRAGSSGGIRRALDLPELIPLELGPLYNDEKESFARFSSVCLGQRLLKHDAPDL